MSRIRAFLVSLFSREELRLWLRLEDTRRRILLLIVLLILGGYAGYQWVATYQKDRHYSAATRALEQYDYDEAGSHLKKSLSWRPTDAEALLLAAQTARRQGLLEESVALLHRAEKSGALRMAVDAEKQLLSVQSGDLNDIEGLKAPCLENPNGPVAALILEAIIEGSMRAQDRFLAISSVDLWLKHRPGKHDQAQGLVWRGRVTQAFNLAAPLPQDDFSEAVELVPDHFQARLHLAGTLINKEPKQALTHLNWLRERRPDDLGVRFQVARYQRSIGQAEEAGQLLDEIIDMAPYFQHAALLERGKVAIGLNRPQEAERFLLQAQALAPMHRDIRIAMADCLRQMNRLEEAEKYLKSVKDNDEKMAKQMEEWKKKMVAGKEPKKS